MRKLTIVTLLIATLLALLYSAHNTPATLAKQIPFTTFTVNSTTDAVDVNTGDGICATANSECTLRAAIQEANALASDDTIILPAGTYTLTLTGANEDVAATGDLDITSNITLNGADAATTTINGDWADRVLHITGSFTVNLFGVTITHGNNTGGGIRNDGGALTIVDSAVSDNNSPTDTGGILNSGSLTVTNSTIAYNNAGTDAGGIANSGTLTIAHSTFSNNNAGGNAGGILSSGTLTITNSTFSENNAGADGGALFNSDRATVADSTFSGNNTGTNGGAIFSSHTLTVTASTFSTNNASNGGGVFTGGGTITVTTSTFSDNSAWAGGGIYDGGGTTAITTSTFSGNTASIGGGVFTQFDVTIANSTFSNNDAGDGSDIYPGGGTLVVSNSTIFGYISDPDRVGVTGNGPAGGGGSGSGIYNGGGSVTLQNSIVASHEAGGNCVGTITNGGHNLDDGTTCGWGSANGSMSNTAPLLGTLTGSPAYFPLEVGSPAIDVGDNAICAAVPVSNTSQNGVTRPADGDGNGTTICDIGAFERSDGYRVYLPYMAK